MKKVILLLLFVTMYFQYSFGQFEKEKFTYDIIIGSDFDLTPPTSQVVADRGFYQEAREDGKHRKFRLGTNISYSYSKRIQFVSGLRFMARTFTSNTIPIGPEICICLTYIPNTTNFYLELPLRSRIFFSDKNNRRFYVEGGVDAQHYLGSVMHLGQDVDKQYELIQEVKTFNWLSNFALGWQFPKENRKASFFFQIAGKYDITPSDTELNLRHLFVGLETGMRF